MLMIQHDDGRDDREDGFRMLVLSLVGIAVVLGACIVRYNAEIDRERERAQDEILRCRRLSMAMPGSSTGPSPFAEKCRRLEDQYIERFGYLH
ncbi:hypothetical protein I9018_18110 [Pseudomonas sp. MPFS]|uniref:hypothetical protein n=1 Tax=Pseudomonas sp. MPFS TaxID=2795724 RepID=UPI001F133424|nr:hypothetical protein [Pseudomonas sp. MPFS]UMZ09454.1 hypothetical protein I9018_18110 [Pseudomonas sp. MPFS]